MIDLSVTHCQSPLEYFRPEDVKSSSICELQQSNLTASLWDDYVFEANKPETVSGCGSSGGATTGRFIRVSITANSFTTTLTGLL